MRAVEPFEANNIKPKYLPTPFGEARDNQIILSRWLDAINVNSNQIIDQERKTITVSGSTTVTGQEVVFELSKNRDPLLGLIKSENSYITISSTIEGFPCISLETTGRFIPDIRDISNLLRTISNAEISGIVNVEIQNKTSNLMGSLHSFFRDLVRTFEKSKKIEKTEEPLQDIYGIKMPRKKILGSYQIDVNLKELPRRKPSPVFEIDKDDD